MRDNTGDRHPERRPRACRVGRRLCFCRGRRSGRTDCTTASGAQFFAAGPVLCRAGIGDHALRAHGSCCSGLLRVLASCLGCAGSPCAGPCRGFDATPRGLRGGTCSGTDRCGARPDPIRNALAAWRLSALRRGLYRLYDLHDRLGAGQRWRRGVSGAVLDGDRGRSDGVALDMGRAAGAALSWPCLCCADGGDCHRGCLAAPVRSGRHIVSLRRPVRQRLLCRCRLDHRLRPAQSAACGLGFCHRNPYRRLRRWSGAWAYRHRGNQ